MVDDPSRIATLLTQDVSDALIAREKVQKSEQVILWGLSRGFSRVGA